LNHLQELTAMSLSFPRLFAAIVLATGAIATALIAFALAVADLVISTAAIPVRPGDAATAHSLAAGTVPLGVFAVFGLAAAAALALRTPRSKTFATFVAAIGVVIGVATAAALIVATGPFATLPSTRVLDGIELIGTFAVIQLVALIALAFDRESTLVSSAAAS
jgi:hypothetical protein